MTAREPLAALVARLRDENGALPFAETWARVTPSEAKRLLAAVEAGTNLLRDVEWKGARGVEGELEACPSCGGLKPGSVDDGDRELYRNPVEGHGPDCKLGAALAEWDGHQ